MPLRGILRPALFPTCVYFIAVYASQGLASLTVVIVFCYAPKTLVRFTSFMTTDKNPFFYSFVDLSYFNNRFFCNRSFELCVYIVLKLELVCWAMAFIGLTMLGKPSSSLAISPMCFTSVNCKLSTSCGIRILFVDYTACFVAWGSRISLGASKPLISMLFLSD